MSHVIFFLSQFLLFTLVCCFILKKFKVIKISLYPLIPMFLYLFAQSSGLYLANINSQIINWIYEVQEIGVALSPGSIFLYLNTEGIIKNRYIKYTLLILSVSTLIMYLLGNFYYLPLWVVTFTWNRVVMYLSIYISSIIYLRNFKTYRKQIYTFLLLMTILFLSELPIDIIKRLKLDLITPLLLCSLWLYIDLKESNSKDEEMLTEEIITKYKLTAREVEVTTKLIEGLSYQDIADELFLSKATIKTYINRVYKKADVSSKVELIHLLLYNR